MTRSEFQEGCTALTCLTCGGTGLEGELHPNNGGFRARCPRCGAVGIRALGGSQEWLPQGAKRRRAGVSTDELRAIWLEAGDHCTFCGKSWALCVGLGIGRSRQHIYPVALGGSEDGLVVPFCARCQQASAAALAETVLLMAHVTSLDDVIARMEARFPELTGGGAGGPA